MCFGSGDITEIKYLTQLNEKRTEYMLLQKKRKTTYDTNNLSILQSKEFEVVNEFKEIKKKWKADVKARAKREGKDDEPAIRFAYIVFRSMDALDYIFHAYKKNWLKRMCIVKFFSKLGCFKKEAAEYKRMYFFKQWPEIEVACEPDNIQWKNLSTSSFSRSVRVALMWVFAVFMLICSVTAIVFMKTKITELKEIYKTGITCEKGMEKYEAWKDQVYSHPARRKGYISCYCQDILNAYGFEALNMPFNEFFNELEMKQDDNLYCQDWAINFALQNALV